MWFSVLFRYFKFVVEFLRRLYPLPIYPGKGLTYVAYVSARPYVWPEDPHVFQVGRGSGAICEHSA